MWFDCVASCAEIDPVDAGVRRDVCGGPGVWSRERLQGQGTGTGRGGADEVPACSLWHYSIVGKDPRLSRKLELEASHVHAETLSTRGCDNPITNLELKPTLICSFTASEYKMMTLGIPGVSV